MNPLVSVIIPVYNAQDFIVDCLDSVRLQDYDNLEVIIIDDMSSDCTRQVLLSYQDQFYSNRIKIYFNKKNLGATKNCNLALSYCQGEYICFFAGDDIMLPGKIKAQVAVMEENRELSFCYHDVEVFESDTGECRYHTSPSGQTIFGVHDLIIQGGLPGANSVMARQSCLPTGGYDVDLSNVSDWKMFIDLSLRGSVGFLEGCYARYRKHSGGLSAQANSLLIEYHNTLCYYEKTIGDEQARKNSARAWRRILLGAIAREIINPKGVDSLKLALSYRPDRFIKFCILFLSVPIARKVLKRVVDLLFILR